MEELVLTGITSKPSQARLTLRDLPAGLRTVTSVLVGLAEGGVSVDLISEAEGTDGRTQLQLTVSEESLESAEGILAELLRGMGGGGIEHVRGLSRIALVGSGMHQRPGVYARAYQALLDREIDVFAVSTSGISITLLVQTEREHEAVRALHEAFTLELIGGQDSAIPAAVKG